MDEEITKEQVEEAKRILLTAHTQYIERFDHRFDHLGRPRRGFLLDLSGADLSHAKFSKCNMSHSDFTDVNFTHAEMEKTCFTHASLRFADLAVVKLMGARLPARFRNDTPRGR